jgi:hypothetical protein
MGYGYNIGLNGDRISGVEKNGNNHNEILLRETIQADYPRISTVAL